MSTILITGAGGFIGSALCAQLSSREEVIGTDITKCPSRSLNINWEQANLTDLNCQKIERCLQFIGIKIFKQFFLRGKTVNSFMRFHPVIEVNEPA